MHPDSRLIRLGCDSYFDGVRLRRVFERIRQIIRDYLAETVSVSADDYLWLFRQQQSDTAVRAGLSLLFYAVADKGGKIGRLEMELKMTGLNTRGVEQFADQAAQSHDLGLSAHMLLVQGCQEAGQFLGRNRLVLQLLETTLDHLVVQLERRQGGIKFVAGDAQEGIHLAIGFARREGAGIGFLALAQQVFPLNDQCRQLCYCSSQRDFLGSVGIISAAVADR